MKFKKSTLALPTGILLFASPLAQAITWNLPAGGSWNTAANWNPATVPTATDPVAFNISADSAITLGANQVGLSLSAASTASSTNNLNRVTLTGGTSNRTLILSGATTITGTVNCIVGSTTTNQNVSLTTTSITKSGTGNLELANANTIGDILVEQGNVFGRNAACLGIATSGTITLGTPNNANSIQYRMATVTVVAKPIVLGGNTGSVRIDTLGVSSPILSSPISGTGNLQITSTNSGVMTYNTGPINPTGNLELKNIGTTGQGKLTMNAPIASNVVNLSIGRDSATTDTSFVRITAPANNYSGNTTVSAGATLQLGASEVIPHGENKGDLNVSGTVNLSTISGDTTETINGLSGLSSGLITRGGDTGTSTLIFGGNNASGLFEGRILEGGTSLISLTKIGTGEITFSSGTSLYRGSTRVLEGTLHLMNGNFLPSGGLVEMGTSAVLNLDFTGTQTVSSFRVGVISQATGKWGRIGSIAELGANFETNRIIGNGLLDNLNSTGVVYWDGTGTSWADLSSWSFSPDSSTPNPLSVPTVGFSTLFGIAGIIGPQTVNLGGNQGAADMQFVSSETYTLLGGGIDRTLSLGSGGITVNADAAPPVLGSSTAGNQVNLTLTASQSWNNKAAGQSIIAHNSVLGTGAALTLAGDGGYVFNGSLSGVPLLTVASLGGVDFNSTVSGIGSLVVGSSVFFNGAVTGSSAFHKLGAGSLNFSGTDTFTGDKSIERGTINVIGDQSAATGGWLLSGYGDTGTTYGTASTTMNFGTDSIITVASGKSIQVGNNLASGGFSAQTINSAGTVTNHGTLFLGRVGTLNVNAGLWTQNGAATVATQGGGIAVLRIDSGARLNYTNASPFILQTSTSTNFETKLTLDGGMLTSGVNFNNPASTLVSGTSSAIVLTNGGTLKLSADVASLFTSAGASIRFECGAGGGIIHTNGFSTALSIPIAGTGGLTKEGAGRFSSTATNSYKGNTLVSKGTLSLSGANLDDDATVTIANDAMLNLEFVGEDTIAALQLGDTILKSGTYDAITHPAFISGTGKLVIPTINPTFASWAIKLGLTGNPEADFDGDGIKDSLEYVLGSDPKVAGSSGVTTQDAGDNFIFTFNRADASETSDLALVVEAGGTLQSWPQVFEIKDTTANSTTGVVIAENADAVDTVTITIPKNGAERLFARIKVVVSNP